MNYIFFNNPKTIDLRKKEQNDAYNPMRLFENDYSSNLNLRNIVKKEEKPLRNKLDGSFVVIASDLELAQSLITKAQKLNLTVSGDDTCKVGKNLGSIVNIQKGNLITFGTSERFDVNWVARRGYAYENGMVPVYDISKDWYKILNALSALASEKKVLAEKEADAIRKGTRPEAPTYRTLKLREVGDAYVSEEKKKLVEDKPLVTKTTITGTMIGSSFIKCGYKLIPVKEVRIQPTYEVRFKPVTTFEFEIREV